jgi:flagellar hook-length control protein FliK
VNGGGASAGGLGGATRAFGQGEEPRQRAGEAAAELWLALSQRASRVETLPTGQIETPSAWRGSAGDLTPRTAAAGAAGGAQAEAPAAERLTLRVDGGELGEIEVTLDRQGGALSVVIGLENGRLVSSVLPDALALRSALEGAGLNVHALSVVPTSEVGTVLAQRRLSPSGPKLPAQQESAEQNPEQAQKQKHKRLTLIG